MTRRLNSAGLAWLVLVAGSLALFSWVLAAPRISLAAAGPASTMSWQEDEESEEPEATEAADESQDEDADEDQDKDIEEKEEKDPLYVSSTYSALKWRGIGPALASGRIGDFAVDPTNYARYFVAVASGGVWYTENNGTTYKPVFDSQGSYSIGCVTLDPSNPNAVWVGTGENNSQRSVSFGDGVYRSRDGGRSWKNVGLKESEHIGMIVVDPRDSDTVYVAAQGPLWRPGGDRGLYKTTDAGETWERILHISDDTGINEIHLDPRDPDTMYASAYQRRRHVWTLIDGGPESGIYKSTDGGANWRTINSGLPGGDKGKIGLDISPANPDIIYAIVMAANNSGGVYRSTNRGERWEKRSSYMSSSPQYYNEIFCDPVNADRIYCLDTLLQRSNDGGRSFSSVPRRGRHVDDHALWINPDNTDHLLVGCDGGVYESFDFGANWLYKPNLPVTQFYRLCVDNSEPFYYVYGGTQDNNTIGGPSRTTSPSGIANQDWFITTGGDGFQSRVDPENPNTVYSQSQYGGLVRFDRVTHQRLDIRPVERPEDEPYRWNWNAPLIISPHNPHRLYFGANVLFRSDDRGESWAVISDDLTRQLNRNHLEIMGRIQPINAVSKHQYTSVFGNTVSLAESPLVEGLIYVGTDDGLINITQDGGTTWKQIKTFPDIPDMTYVTYLFASQHDADTVYAAFDNHKKGDFKPYLLVSRDRGETWSSIAGDLPERSYIHAIAQDHVKAGLLFVGTEFGVHFTPDEGEHWMKLGGGMPTISVRGLETQSRENDLVAATFGRGFYVMDDYTPLRLATSEILEEDAHIFPIKPALWYIPTSRKGGSQGATFYTAPNPSYGAVFTYYLKDTIKTLAEERKEAEKEAKKAKDEAEESTDDETDVDEQPPVYPTIDQLRAEDEQRAPRTIITVYDDAGNLVRRLPASRSKGMHRATWNLRYPAVTPASTSGDPSGPLALPGTYWIMLERELDGHIAPLAGPEEFEVVPLFAPELTEGEREESLAFQQKVGRLQRAVQAASRVTGETQTRLDHIRQAILVTPEADYAGLIAHVDDLEKSLRTIRISLNGDSLLRKYVEPAPLSISRRVSSIVGTMNNVTYAPTGTCRQQYEYAADEFEGVLSDLRQLAEHDLPDLEEQLEQAGAPWTPGRRLPDWQPE
ncbi:MAG: glycosyl hydrolase [Planctomycetes bacterium]|nr:glycosyl hydrolase [Planctomycetota bacterium]